MTENSLNIKNLFSDLMLSQPANAEVRQKAFAEFESLGLPTRSNEDWKYTSLKSLQAPWKLASAENFEKTLVTKEYIRIFSYNGFFDLKEIESVLKPFGVEVQSAELFIKDYNQVIPFQKKTFWHLSHAFLQAGLFLKIPDRTEVPLPIIIEHIVDSENLFVHPYVAVSLGRNSSASIMEKFNSSKNNTWLNSTTSVSIGENSILNYFKTYSGGEMVSHVDNNYFEQKTSSTLRFVNFAMGSQLLRNDTHVEVLGENASSDLRGLSILQKKNQMDHNVRVHHVAPNSMSRQIFKSILRDESHYVFQGNIYIDSIAQKTDASQLNKNLLLNKKCRVDAKPQIDVYADDVKATHGSATGQLNAEEKFYLETRGMSSEKATSLLCDGFAKSILEHIPHSYLQQDVLKTIIEVNRV